MFTEQLRRLRKGMKMTQTDLAARFGITQQAVGRWERGQSLPDSETMMALAELFGVSVDSLLGAAPSGLGEVMPYQPAGQAMIPVMGVVRAGYGAVAFEEDLGAEPASVKDPSNYFYLVVRGDSMEPRIQEGDLALVRKQQTLDDGDLGVVVYGQGEGTLKRFVRKGNTIMLQAFNPAYEPLVLAGEELSDLYIAGKVVETKSRW